MELGVSGIGNQEMGEFNGVKIINGVEIQALRLRERAGVLNKRDFKRLINHDFVEYIEKHPGLSRTFSPSEELKIVRSLPKEQKHEALTSFKDKLIRQQDALVVCRLFIEREIEFNNDVPKEKLMGWVEKFGTKFGFANEQKEISEKLIDWYLENRKRVKDLYIKHQGRAVEMVNELTGLSFNDWDKLDVSVGPMNMQIIGNGVDTNKIFNRDMSKIAPLSHDGFQDSSGGDNPIYFTVISRRITKTDRFKSIQIHEMEHIKNRLFERMFASKLDDKICEELCDTYDQTGDTQVQKETLEDLFVVWRKYVLDQVKDEVFAMKKDGGLYDYDKVFFTPGNSYDYLGSVRDNDSVKDDPLWREMGQKILIDGYKQIVKGAINAFDNLIKIGGYTTDKAIAVLASENLEKWGRVVDRIVEQKYRMAV